MANIIMIETDKSSDLIQDVMEFVLDKAKCNYTQMKLEMLENSERILSFPGLCIDMEQYTIRRNNKVIPVSHYEFYALAYLARQSERVFTKEQIYNEVYNDEKAVNIDNAVYCLIRDIRKKLKSDRDNYEYIQTVRGIGYKFVIPGE